MQEFRPKSRQESRFGNRKSFQNCCILNSLAILGKEDLIVILVENMFYSANLGSSGQGADHFQEGKEKGNTNVRQCRCKVVDRHFTEAVKVLCSSGVASHEIDTTNALKAKHQYKPPHPC